MELGWTANALLNEILSHLLHFKIGCFKLMFCGPYNFLRKTAALQSRKGSIPNFNE